MTRARELARLGNENVLSVEDDSLEVGINSTKPTSALDVAGQFNVGTAIKAGVAGVITATEFSGSIGTFSGAGSFGGNLDVTGNVTIGGTLTYEDVTNIDVIGIVTAQNGVNISGGQLLVGSGVTIGNAGVATFSGTSDIHLLDNVRLNVGDGSDFAIYHDGSHSYIADSGTGRLHINTSQLRVNNAADNEILIDATENTGVSLYDGANTVRFATTNDGTVTTGIATATGLDVADKITHTGDANTAIRFPSADTISLETAGSERARFTSDGEFLIGTTTDNGFKFKVSDGGASEFAFAPNDSGVNSLVNYDRVGAAYTNFKLTALQQTFFTGTSPSERVRLDSDGRLHIGSSNNTGANTKLVVGAGNNINTTAIINSGDVDVDALTLSNWDGSTTTNKLTIHFDSSGIGGWNIGMPAATDAFVVEDDGGAEKLRITQTAVGINTTNPNHELTVFGDEVNFRLTHDGSTNKYNALYTSVDGTGVTFNSYQDGTGTKRPFIFTQYDTERARIDADGKLGINTTNTGGGYLGLAVDSSSTNVLATGAIALNLKNLNTTDNTWVSMDFNNSVGGIVGRIGAQFKDTSDKDTDIYFATRADGGSLAERLRISSDAGVELTGHSECNINALGNSSGTVTIDFTTANYISCTLTGTTTFANPTTESVGQSGSIIITQDGTGSRTASWGSQFKWVGGTAPTLTTTAAAVDRIDYLVVAADTIHCVASLDVK